MASVRQGIVKYCKKQGIEIINLECLRSPEYIYGDYQGCNSEWCLVVEIKDKICEISGNDLDEVVAGIKFEIEESEE